MSDPSDDDAVDPAIEALWFDERRQEVHDYLAGEGIIHGRIETEPAWHVVPYVSVWAIESLGMPGRVEWWAISGDMPNDYVAAADIETPREAVRAMASLWLEAAGCMSRGEQHPTFRIGTGQRDAELASMLESRAELLLEWVDDSEVWD